jgi:hypothetical protein
MKIWIDHLPTEPHECLFHRREQSYWGFSFYVCVFNGEKCVLEDGEKCPYLQELCGSQSL